MTFWGALVSCQFEFFILHQEQHAFCLTPENIQTQNLFYSDMKDLIQVNRLADCRGNVV